MVDCDVNKNHTYLSITRCPGMYALIFYRLFFLRQYHQAYSVNVESNRHPPILNVRIEWPRRTDSGRVSRGILDLGNQQRFRYDDAGRAGMDDAIRRDVQSDGCRGARRNWRIPRRWIGPYRITHDIYSRRHEDPYGRRARRGACARFERRRWRDVRVHRRSI